MKKPTDFISSFQPHAHADQNGRILLGNDWTPY